MKNLFLFLTLFTAVLVVSVSCTKNTKQVRGDIAGISGDSIEAAITLMQQYVDSGKRAGISVMVMKDGETVLTKDFGYADLENQKPIDDKTIFRAFSMTKPITAAALMTLFEEGKFQLDDKVSQYIPEFATTRVYNPETKTTEPQQTEMTVRHLLTHTSGLTYGWDRTAYVDSLYRVSGAGGWDATLAEKVKILAGIPLKYQPGTRWEYGLSIDVAGYLAEVLSGMPLDEFFKSRIFDPLKMDDTGFYVPGEKHSRFARVYSFDKNGKLKGPENPAADNFLKPVRLFSGGGGLVTTVDDYSRFAQMLLNGGELDGVRILSEPTVKLIMSNQLPENVVYENGGGYGLGGSFNIENGQYGWTGAASTFFTIDPQNNMIILVFTQFMPYDIGYAIEFSERVQRAVIE